MVCFDREKRVEEGIDRVMTQWRESPRLLAIMRHQLNQIVEVGNALCDIPSKHDIDTGIGDQLTNVGKRLGWPRCHCVCAAPGPVWGWDCAPASPTITYTDICDDAGCWENPEEIGSSTICFEDDETYRGYLRARRYQYLRLYDLESLQAAAQHIWGAGAVAYSMGDGKAAVAPGRALTSAETQELQLAFRVLPFAPGISTHIDLSFPIFGLGEGWANMCDSQWACPQPFDPYNCN